MLSNADTTSRRCSTRCSGLIPRLRFEDHGTQKLSALQSITQSAATTATAPTLRPHHEFGELTQGRTRSLDLSHCLTTTTTTARQAQPPDPPRDRIADRVDGPSGTFERDLVPLGEHVEQPDSRPCPHPRRVCCIHPSPKHAGVPSQRPGGPAEGLYFDCSGGISDCVLEMG